MSDDEELYNPKAHRTLLQAISSLGNTQHIRKSTRSEAQPHQDEFRLVKSVAAAVEHGEHAPASAVGINDLVQILKRTKKHVDTGKQLKNVQSTKRVLHKPLEKPEAERIKRTIGYESVKKKLLRWDAVVAKNRSAETQIFPLPSETVYINTASHAPPMRTSLKSDLARDLAAADSKLRALKKARAGDNVEEKELEKREELMLQKKITRDELIARRKELAYLKMRESQKSAKARLKNKIKSKKYHKLLKRQKMLEQMKEFELQAKTNPEAALEKLNELEKTRVLERASLRHKNTGTWAKNLKVRAKYDKEVRKDLAEQLTVSRQLTEKKNSQDNDSDNDNEDRVDISGVQEVNVEKVEYDPFNPWTKAKNGTGKVEEGDDSEQDPNWRKYWLQRNQNEKQLQDYKEDIKATVGEDSSPKFINVMVTKKKKNSKKTKKPLQFKANGYQQNEVIEDGWLVEEIKDHKISKNIDDIFDAQEDKIRAKLSKKLKQLNKKAERLKKKPANSQIKSNKSQKDALQNLKDLSFKNSVNRPDIDEELNNEDLAVGIESSKRDTNIVDEDKNNTTEELPNVKMTSIENNTIDPNKIAAVKLNHNLAGIQIMEDAIDDDNIDEGEYEYATQQQLTISQAFEDDDIIADFSRDKTKDSELKQSELQLSMPGWGSWAGAGIVSDPVGSKNSVSNRNKRLVLQLAQGDKRRDENKEGVYINENATNKHLRSHLVSDVPFPFTSVQDYEASIRAPIGRNFVPETAFRMLTRPAVITRKGAIIEPMDESELVKPPRRLRHIVDRRIERATVANIKVK